MQEPGIFQTISSEPSTSPSPPSFPSCLGKQSHTGLTLSIMSSLSLLLARLAIPSDFARYEAVSEPNVISELEIWKDNASRVLSEVKSLLNEKLSIQEHADVVSAVAPFTAAEAWVTPESRTVSTEILHQLPEPDGQLLEHILVHNVKPLFVSSPHPHLNLSTGRRLARPAGGPMNTQDFFEGQTWKEHPGTAEVVLYVVRNLKASEYEGVWHLVIPPVMTLLDNYQGQYKLRGVQIVAVMLHEVPSQLLKRTGLDSLLIQSLSSCMGLIRDPESPDLLRAAIAAWLTLTTKTTEVGSAEQFDRLSVLLGEHIIGSVWLYGSSIAPVILATVETLPPIVRQLGIGSARFLKALMYQLLHPLQQVPGDTEMQLRSIDALLVVMEECAPRIAYWRGAILNAVARCFVAAKEDGKVSSELVISLRRVCQELLKLCPSVMEDDFPRLLKLDRDMFLDLVGDLGVKEETGIE